MRRRSIVAGILVLVAAFVAGYVSSRPAAVGVEGPPRPGDARSARVQRVVDGDTIVLIGLGKARLIGVNTPEVYGGAECFGERASQFAKEELGGQEVRYLVGREGRDRYGRLLVYVWLADGRSFNAMLLAGGFARTLTIAPNDRYASTFAVTAGRARRAGAGLWSACQ